MPVNCNDCKVELLDKTGDTNKCSRQGDMWLGSMNPCHNCLTWGPSCGDGDNPWYKTNACEGCKRRLVDGRFKAADKWKAKAAEMKAILAPQSSAAEENERRRQAQAEAEAEEKRRQRQWQAQAQAEAEEKRRQAQAQAQAEERRRQAQAQAQAEERQWQAQFQAEAEEKRRQAQAEAEAEEKRWQTQFRAQAEARRQREEREEEERRRLEAGRKAGGLQALEVRVPAAALQELRRPKVLGLSTKTVQRIGKVGSWAARIGEALPVVGGCVKALGEACKAAGEYAEQKKEFCNKLLHLEDRLNLLESAGLRNVRSLLSRPDIAQDLWSSGVREVFLGIAKVARVFEGAVAQTSKCKTEVSALLQSLVLAIEAGAVEEESSDLSGESEESGMEYDGSLSPEDLQRLTSDVEFCFQALNMCVSSSHFRWAVDGSPRGHESLKNEIGSQLSQAETALNEGNTAVGGVVETLTRYRIRVIDEGDVTDVGATQQLLGSGASGTVLLRMYLRNHQVAVKVTTGVKDSISQSVLTECYLNCKLTTDLTRPHVVPYLYGVFLSGFAVAIVSEAASFGALDTILYKRIATVATNGQLSRLDVDAQWIKQRQLGWLRDVARALHILHSKYGIRHCDVKAANMLLFGSEGEEVKLGDLGCSYVARDQRTMSKAGITSGMGYTLKYRAPERADESVAAGAAVRPEAPVDVYSFGMLGFEVMYGCEAWEEKRDIDIENAIKKRKGFLKKMTGGGVKTRFPDPPSPLPLGSPPDAEVLALLSDCCRTKPEKRPAMELVAQVLESKVAGAR